MDDFALLILFVLCMIYFVFNNKPIRWKYDGVQHEFIYQLRDKK